MSFGGGGGLELRPEILRVKIFKERNFVCDDRDAPSFRQHAEILNFGAGFLPYKSSEVFVDKNESADFVAA